MDNKRRFLGKNGASTGTFEFGTLDANTPFNQKKTDSLNIGGK